VPSLKSRIMVMRIKSLLIGVLVDEVKDVLSVMDNALSRNFHPQVVLDPKYLLGSVSHEEQIVLVINAQKLFTASEFIELDKRSVHV
jgi:chemotaxis signal transduction protein